MDSFRGDGLNLYAYVANNPVNYIDPTGYCKESTDSAKEVTNVLNKYRIAGAGFFDYGWETVMGGNIFDKVKESYDNIKGIIDLGMTLYNNQVTMDELKQIIGDKVTDILAGGLIYVKDNYYIMGNGVTTTDKEVYQLGYPAGRAYNELIRIGLTAYGVGKTIKAGITKLRAKNNGIFGKKSVGAAENYKPSNIKKVNDSYLKKKV